MIKSITKFLAFSIFQQFQSQISQIDKMDITPFFDETSNAFSKRRNLGYKLNGFEF